MAAAPIVLAGVVKRYGSQPALDGLDMRVEAGEVFGFLGPNGAGKTTAMRILLGLLRADAGTVRLLAADPWRAVAERGRVGYLPSQPRFYERMAGGALLEHLARLSGRAARLRATCCDALQLSERDLGRPVREYSKGMRQKLGVVQAMQHDPELLVMDEPTEGLDPLVQDAFFELLRGRRAAGRTVLFSSHVLSEVEELCERVGMVRAGRMVAVRSLAELKAEQPRLVTVTFAEESAAHAFELAGAERLALDGATLRLAYGGDVNRLVAALADETVADLRVEQPDLDEIFLTYYGDEPRPAVAGVVGP